MDAMMREPSVQRAGRSPRGNGLESRRQVSYRFGLPFMLKVLPAAVLFAFVLASGAALAYDCAPHCDYVHDYGPYDLSWVAPGLVGYPVCDRAGNCSPHLVYRQFGPRRVGITITVRPTHHARPIVRRSKVE